VVGGRSGVRGSLWGKPLHGHISCISSVVVFCSSDTSISNALVNSCSLAIH